MVLRIAEHLLTSPGPFEVQVVSRSEGSAHGIFSSRLPMLYPARSHPRLAAYERAFRVLSETQPDLVYANSVESFEYCVAATALGIPRIYHLHELEGGFDRLAQTHGFNTEKDASLFGECADLFICPCHETRALLLDRFGVEESKIRLVHEFIDPERVLDRSRSGSAVLRGPGPRVVGCGTAVRRKGIDLFMRTAAQMPDVPFVWIGKSTDPDIEFRVPANVRLAGELDNPFPQMASAEVFFLPSREDAFPLVVLEAMALGLPVVAWRRGGGIHSALEGWGAVVEEPTPDHFERAIRGLLEDPTQRAQAGKVAMERVRRLYNAGTHLPIILDLIRAVVAKGTTPPLGDPVRRRALHRIREGKRWEKKLSYQTALRTARRMIPPVIKRLLKKSLFFRLPRS